MALSASTRNCVTLKINSFNYSIKLKLNSICRIGPEGEMVKVLGIRGESPITSVHWATGKGAGEGWGKGEGVVEFI